MIQSVRHGVNKHHPQLLLARIWSINHFDLLKWSNNRNTLTLKKRLADMRWKCNLMLYKSWSAQVQVTQCQIPLKLDKVGSTWCNCTKNHFESILVRIYFPKVHRSINICVHHDTYWIKRKLITNRSLILDVVLLTSIRQIGNRFVTCSD